MKKIKVSSEHRQEFLELHDIYPLYTDICGNAYYRKTPELLLLLDRYDIIHICIRNKLRPQ